MMRKAIPAMTACMPAARRLDSPLMSATLHSVPLRYRTLGSTQQHAHLHIVDSQR